MGNFSRIEIKLKLGDDRMKQIEIQGCRMELIYLTDEKKHCHQDIELIYLIERQASVDAEESYTLKANDIAVINSNIEHSIRADLKQLQRDTKTDRDAAFELLEYGQP